MMPLEIRLIQCKSAASPSKLPGLDWAVNPYRGCSHKCAYCYAQDVTRFELGKPWGEVIEVRINFVERLKKDVMRGADGVYGIGTVTDPYQHTDKKYELTRGCLRIMKEANARISLLTKSDLVLRDIDILSSWEGAEVAISIGTADEEKASIVEPGAPPPRRRFDALAKLVDAEIDTFLMAAPIIHGLADAEEDIAKLVTEAAGAGVSKIMWDRFNPKPLASRRLRDALSAEGIPPTAPHSSSEVQRIRALLRSECIARQIELIEAF